MIILKSGVRLIGLRTEAALAISIAYSVYQDNAVKDMVVTSVNDGAHGPRSLHPLGFAFDLRIHNVPAPRRVERELKVALGADFDVILESEGLPNQHIHVEYDPVR